MNDSREEAIQYAKKFLEDILSFFGLNTDIYATANDDDIIELHVPSTHLNGFLIGQRGETIRALQFMASNALRNNNFQYSRVHVDVADYKKQRAERVAEQVEEWVASVKSSGEPMALRPMNSADRRVVHKVATDAGLTTESVGEGRDRHVVINANGDKAEAETN
jgi:spoIIIJ-associated protein